MGSTSAFGIGFAVLTAALASSTAAQQDSSGGVDLRIQLDHLRNHRGLVHACLTQNRQQFPDCKADPRALKLTAPAREARGLHFANVAPGTYALAVIHDENGNGKLDTIAKIPREGFGFSRNPRIRFGPPKFGESSFTLAPGGTVQIIRVRYLL